MKITTVLFDFDGVIANTEPQYDKFSEEMAGKYKLGDDFADLCRGTTLETILETHFADMPEKQKEELRKYFTACEYKIQFPWVAGAQSFIAILLEKGYKLGLVTSSPMFKMKRALKEMLLEDTFGTMVTADDIERGKPNPSCYILAMSNLGAKPSESIVFEDAILGIQAARGANVRKVVGFSTSFSKEELEDITDHVIPNFEDINLVMSFLE